jgi:hypothetical protein
MILSHKSVYIAHSTGSITVLKLTVLSGFGGLGVSMLASGTQVCGFERGRSHRIFQGEKNPQHAFLRRGSPMSQPCGM